MNEYYVAGFFDGEGSTWLQPYTQNGRQYNRVRATITQNSTDVLEQIVDWMGCGKVKPKGDQRANPCWHAVFSDLSARKFLVRIEPFLIVKKQHVSDLLDLTGRDTVDRRLRG